MEVWQQIRRVCLQMNKADSRIPGGIQAGTKEFGKLCAGDMFSVV